MKKQTTAEVNPETFHGLSKLEPNEQDKVKAESQKLTEALRSETQSKLAVGEALVRLRDVLEPKKIFVSYLRYAFEMSVPTAYRYIEYYTTAHSKLPKPVIEMALQRGAKIDIAAIEKNPPPDTKDKGKIIEYLSNLRPVRVEVAQSPDLILKECVNFVSTRWDRLPNNQRAKVTFMRNLIGMLMTKFGTASEQTFSPMAIPDNFRTARGRPRIAA